MEWPWQDRFAAARNESLRQARGQGVLWLDADERLDEDNRRRLSTLLAGLGAENAAYAMRQRSPLEPGLHAAAEVDQIRLFPRFPELRWRYRVHQQILPGLRQLGAEVRRTYIVIEYADFAEPSRQGPSLQRQRGLQPGLARTGAAEWAARGGGRHPRQPTGSAGREGAGSKFDRRLATTQTRCLTRSAGFPSPPPAPARERLSADLASREGCQVQG